MRFSKPKPIDINRELSVVGRRLMISSPFYGFFMMTLNKKVTKDVDTAAVSKRGIDFELNVNPIFWKTLSQKEKVGVFKHEMLHIVLNHLTMHKNFSNKLLYNIAADLYINSLIIKENGKEALPNATITQEQYGKLVKPLEKVLETKIKTGELSSSEIKDLRATIPIRGCYPLDFGFSVNECIGLGTHKIYKKLEGSDNQNLKDALDKAEKDSNGSNDSSSSANVPWSHKDWKDIIENSSDEELDILQKQVEYQIKKVVNDNELKSRGKIPGYLLAIIEKLFKKNPPVTDWKAYMRRFTSSSSDRYTKRTRRKESRRIPGMPGIRIKTKKRVLVLIDTSASVTNNEIFECRNELYHIQKLGFKVDVCEVDTAIGPDSIYEFKGKFRDYVTGRGGTNFDPGIAYANSVYKKYSCAIYMTDGECRPSKFKSRLSLLWILTTRGLSIKRFRELGHTEPAIKIIHKVTS